MNDDETTCPQCAETIKAAAKVCKHCGYRVDSASTPTDPTFSVQQPTEPLHTPMQFKPWYAVAGVAALIAVVGGAVGMANLMGEQMRLDSPTVEATGIAYIKNSLVDPDSAQFTELYSNDHCVTGKVNAKNSFGGYVGAVDFYYDARKRLGRTSDGKLALSLVGTDAFDSESNDRKAFDHETSVCVNSEAEVATRDAQAAKMVAGWKADENTK
ncbi:zinc ribbon domain-containing protein [Sphingomonas sp. PB2P12]|uniref:zinc ribbon domain-containing protein n=1 Tax=Sphingomonas sandaracina TaxID=3096157 RepID=UPI002FCBE123